MDSLSVKKEKAIEMFEQLIQNTNSEYKIVTKGFDKEIIKPSFLNN